MTGRAQTAQQPRTEAKRTFNGNVIKLLSSNTDYRINLPLSDMIHSAQTGRLLASPDDDGLPKIVYDPDIEVALERRQFAIYLIEHGIKPTEVLAYSSIPNSYAESGSGLLELAGRLRLMQESQEMRVMEGLRRGQQ